MTVPILTPKQVDWYRRIAIKTGVIPEISNQLFNTESLVVFYHPGRRTLRARIKAVGEEGPIENIEDILQLGSQVRNGSPTAYDLVRFRGDQAVVTNEITIIGQQEYGNDGYIVAFKPQLKLAGAPGQRPEGALTLPRDHVTIIKPASLEAQLESVAAYLRSTRDLHSGKLPARHYTPPPFL